MEKKTEPLRTPKTEKWKMLHAQFDENVNEIGEYLNLEISTDEFIWRLSLNLQCDVVVPCNEKLCMVSKCR
jgi:hypothetical protein